ncbi:MAG: hypothetical protein A3G24_23265 [Betaproteobacteria bacterium RIFCSPLOWO2_12_FULL_62_13]|nr:MAG: hypothetical protein A3G24_23265 [Betaproteobacteria bacterium RIFCSPLOWO2_12_FULL_62_13]
MLKRKLAGIVVAGLFFGAGAVSATETVFPSESSESTGSTVWYRSDIQKPNTEAGLGAKAPVFPSESSESGSSAISYEGVAQPMGVPEGLTGATDLVFPSGTTAADS